jgi:hypothetical protein
LQQLVPIGALMRGLSLAVGAFFLAELFGLLDLSCRRRCAGAAQTEHHVVALEQADELPAGTGVAALELSPQRHGQSGVEPITSGIAKLQLGKIMLPQRRQRDVQCISDALIASPHRQ